MLSALVSAVLAAVIVHRKLRPPLEARGVRPWRLIDSLAAAPLVLAGAALAGGAGAAVAGVMTGVLTPHALWWAVPALAAAAFLILLGRLALRKLFD